MSTFLFSFIIEPKEICLSLGLWLAGYNTPLLGDAMYLNLWICYSTWQTGIVGVMKWKIWDRKIILDWAGEQSNHKGLVREGWGWIFTRMIATSSSQSQRRQCNNRIPGGREEGEEAGKERGRRREMKKDRDLKMLLCWPWRDLEVLCRGM